MRSQQKEGGAQGWRTIRRKGVGEQKGRETGKRRRKRLIEMKVVGAREGDSGEKARKWVRGEEDDGREGRRV